MSKSGMTALYYAVYKVSNSALVKLLLEHGAEVHHKYDSWYCASNATVLDYLLDSFYYFYGNGTDIRAIEVEVIKALMENGAEDKFFEARMTVACEARDLDAVRSLQALGADINSFKRRPGNDLMRASLGCPKCFKADLT